MIIEKIGDLLAENVNIIAHQTNCKGVMGAGIAKQIKMRLLSVSQYDSYVNYCVTHEKKALGTVQYFVTNDKRIVANLFGEDIPTGKGRDTNYEALYTALEVLRDKVIKASEEEQLSIGFPGGLGCGLAGGDWNVVRAMIYSVFEKTDIPVTICYIDEALFKLFN